LVWRHLSPLKHHPRWLWWLPLRGAGRPALRAALAPQLKGLLSAELLTPFEQRRRLIAQPTLLRASRDLGLSLANVQRPSLNPPPVPSPAGGSCHRSSPGSGESGVHPGQSSPGAAGRWRDQGSGWWIQINGSKRIPWSVRPTANAAQRRGEPAFKARKDSTAPQAKLIHSGGQRTRGSD